MRPAIRGRALFVFSDPGGAKPCLALIEENNLTDVLAISDRIHSFYPDFKTPVQVQTSNFNAIFDTFKPDLVFTGTSYTSEIELTFLKTARQKLIQTCSFIDHWTSIDKRFISSTGELCLPDKIWVIDERAKKLSITIGITEDHIIIAGNPYHDWLKKWKPTIRKNEFFDSSGIILKNNEKVILYAPDPISNINGKRTFGFDEFSATREMVELFKSNPISLANWKVLVKPHPNQNIKGLKEITDSSLSFIFLDKDINVNNTIFYSDVVLGFFSSLLIEATILNKPVIRYLISSAIYDPLKEQNIGHLADNNNLISLIKEFSK